MLPRPTIGLTTRLSLLISLLLFIYDPISALGINCRGSLICGGQGVAHILQNIVSIANSIKDNDIYGNNQHIVCLPYHLLGHNPGSFCLFMQGDHPNSYLNPITGKIIVGVDGQTIKEKVNDLYSHGCRGCGSVPIGPNNDPNSQGILTVNYVATPGCDGPDYDGRSTCTPIIPYYAAFNPLNADAAVLSSQSAAAQTPPPPPGANSSVEAALKSFRPTTMLQF